MLKVSDETKRTQNGTFLYDA